MEWSDAHRGHQRRTGPHAGCVCPAAVKQWLFLRPHPVEFRTAKVGAVIRTETHRCCRGCLYAANRHSRYRPTTVDLSRKRNDCETGLRRVLGGIVTCPTFTKPARWRRSTTLIRTGFPTLSENWNATPGIARSRWCCRPCFPSLRAPRCPGFETSCRKCAIWIRWSFRSVERVRSNLTRRGDSLLISLIPLLSFV